MGVVLVLPWFLVFPPWVSAQEIHSLEYIYTALSKPVAVPGIYEFSAMGILDDKEIDYYNSKNKVKIPRQNWMSERLDKNYWEKGTQSRKSKEQWFKVNIDILMNRMNHNKSDVHVLQWKHGCQGVRQPDGSLKFQKGFDLYSYDGEDFLSFDDSNSQWVAPVTAAEATKRKWDDSQTLNQYTKGYLQKECMDWLSKFMTYGEVELKKHSPPKVFIFGKKSKNPEKVVLHCLATGFYPKDVELVIYRSGVPLNETDGVTSTGVRPNGVSPERVNPNDRPEDTFQLRMFVEVYKSDKSNYSCEVKHRSLKEPITVQWDGSCYNCAEGCNPGIIIGSVLVLLILVFAIFAVVFLHIRGIIVIPFLPFGNDRNKNAAPYQGAEALQNGNGTVHISSQPKTSVANGSNSSGIMPEEKPLLTVNGHSSGADIYENIDGEKQSANGNVNSSNNPE